VVLADDTPDDVERGIEALVNVLNIILTQRTRLSASA
jgi:hypothetical protein